MVIFYTANMQFVLCTITTVWFVSSTEQEGTDCNQQLCLQRGSSGLTYPPSRTCTGLWSGKGQLTALQTPHISGTNYLNFYLQVSATENQQSRRQFMSPGWLSEHTKYLATTVVSFPVVSILYYDKLPFLNFLYQNACTYCSFHIYILYTLTLYVVTIWIEYQSQIACLCTQSWPIKQILIWKGSRKMYTFGNHFKIIQKKYVFALDLWPGDTHVWI